MQQSLSRVVPTWLAGLFIAAVCLSFTGRPAHAEGEQTLEELVAILQNVSQTPRTADTPEEDARNFEMLRRGVPQLNAYMQREDFVSARRVVRSWMRQTKSDALQKLCRAVVGHLEKRLDATETPLLDRADELIEQAREICHTARTAADVDPVAESLFEFRNFEMGNLHSRTMQRVRQRIDNTVRFVETYQQYLEAFENGDHPQALNYLNQLAQNFSFRLLASSELHERRNALERRILDDATKTLDEIAAAIRVEMDVEDLQNLQSQLDDVSMRIQSGRSMHSVRMRLDRSRNALQAWMAVLMAEANGDVRAALDQLRIMQESVYRDMNLIPAEVIIARHNALLKKLGDDVSPHDAEVQALLKSVRRASDFGAVRARVETLRLVALSASSRRDFDVLVVDLGRLQALHEAVDSGRLEPVWAWASTLESSQQHRWSPAIAELRDEVIRRAIRVTAGIDTFEPADANETPAAGTLRLADEAAAAGDWQRVYRLLDTYALAFTRQVRPAWLQAELTACRAYLAGRQLEQFGQREKAAESYLLVLQQVGERVPRKEAAERLKSLAND